MCECNWQYIYFSTLQHLRLRRLPRWLPSHRIRVRRESGWYHYRSFVSIRRHDKLLRQNEDQLRRHSDDELQSRRRASHDQSSIGGAHSISCSRRKSVGPLQKWRLQWLQCKLPSEPRREHRWRQRTRGLLDCSQQLGQLVGRQRLH